MLVPNYYPKIACHHLMKLLVLQLIRVNQPQIKSTFCDITPINNSEFTKITNNLVKNKIKNSKMVKKKIKK